MRILDDQTVVRLFGDPAPLVDAQGVVAAAWEERILGWVLLPAPLPLAWDRARSVTRFRAHKLIAAPLQAALKEAHAEPDVWATINDFGGCYQWRAQRGGKSLSRHSWGIAVDLDVGDNPMGKEARTDTGFANIMGTHGFGWGGLFDPPRTDGMHWEIVRL